MKSPNKNTGREGDAKGDESSGVAASAVLLASAAMSRSFALCEMYVPPTTIGDDSSGDDIQINPASVRVCLCLYDVLCGMS